MNKFITYIIQLFSSPLLETNNKFSSLPLGDAVRCVEPVETSFACHDLAWSNWLGQTKKTLPSILRTAIIVLLLTFSSIFSFAQPLSAVQPKNSAILAASPTQFKWNSIEGAVNYKFELSTVADFSSVIHQSNTTQLLYNYPSTLALDSYYWRIIAEYPSLPNDTSSIYSFTVFAPSLIPNLKLWLNADSVELINNKVSKWPDLSGNNNHVLQSDTNYRPIKALNQLNGQPTVQFDGINDYLDGGDILNIGLKSQSIYTIAKSNNNSGAIISKSLAGGANNRYSLLFVSQSLLYLFQDDATRTITYSTASINTFLYLSTMVDNNINKIILNSNNVQKGINSYNSSNNFTTTYDFLLGAYNNGSGTIPPYSVYYLKGDIAEIIIFDTIPSTSSQNIINEYLSYKYAPPVSLGYDIKVDYKLCDTILDITANHFTHYVWSTGDTTGSISVNSTGSYWVQATNIFGQISSDTVEVYIPTRVSLPDTTICLGNSFQYNWTPLTHYTLSWSNGNVGSTFTETQAGTYSFILTDTLGCTYRDTFNLFVDSLSMRMSLGNDTALCSGNTISYSLNNYTLQNPQFLWSNGSILSTTLAADTGNYWVQITNDLGCVARDTIHINIRGNAPVVSFTAPGKCLGLATAMSDLSYSTDISVINNWQWNFGDGESSTSQNPTHQYSAPGIYQISLTATTDSLCSNSSTIPTVVYSLPQAQFSPQLGCAHASIQFIDGTLSSDGYTLQSWNWNFGENQSGSSNVSTIQNPTHQFDTAGTYNVQLKATSNVGCTDSIIKIITIRPAPIANFNSSNTCEGETTWFSDSSSVDSWNPITDRLWEFNDGDQSTLPFASKLYPTYGSYPVTYIIKSLNGCIDTLEKEVHVYALPVANFTPNNYCLNQPILLQSNSSVPDDSITMIQWNIGNQTMIMGSPVQIYMDSAATYPVQLKIATLHHCSDTITKNITVKPVPQTSFTYNYDELSIGYNIQFINTSLGGSSYAWYAPEGLFSSVQNPVYDFNHEGTYPVLLIATNTEMCSDSSTTNVLVTAPQMDISISDLSITAIGSYQQAQVNLSNLSNRNITDLWITLQINEQQIRERWTGMIRPGEVIPYAFKTQVFIPSGNTPQYGCATIESPLFSNETNLNNNQTCITLGEEFKIVKLYPNPASDHLNLWITAPAESKATLHIQTSAGKEVYQSTNQILQKGVTQIKIPLTNLSNGLYILEVEFANSTERIKFNVLKK